MDTPRFREIAARYQDLRVAIVGDFCLDRYLEIDPGRSETSIETALEVYNVVNVRSQPGGAGTILNNLIDLGVGRLLPVGFHGRDGEGAELRQALERLNERGQLDLRHFRESDERRTFTYTKPLITREGEPPRELNRLDFKNWDPTPGALSMKLAESVRSLADEADAFVILDQVDLAGTGVITDIVLEAVADMAKSRPDKLILGDSRNAIDRFPPVSLKLNDHEFRRHLVPVPDDSPAAELSGLVKLAANRRQSRIFVTLGADGIVCGSKDSETESVPAHPVLGEIDIVGAGDAVTANLAAALAAGASATEAMRIAMAAASVVIHKLGTTGTASTDEISAMLARRTDSPETHPQNRMRVDLDS